MAIDQITFPNNGQASGSETQNNTQFVRTETLVAEITSNAPQTDNTNLIQAESGFFAGGPHPFIPFMWATRVRTIKKTPILYELTADYATRGKQGQSPLDEPPVISFDFAINEEVIDVDYLGKPMIFKTGEQPDPPTRDTVYDQIIRCQRNISFAQWNPDLVSTYAGKTNQDTFLWFPPGTARITEPPRATSKQFDDFEYWEVTMGVQIRRGIPGLYDDSKAWYKRVLAQGYYVNNAHTDKNSNIVAFTERARDKSGVPVTRPVLHNVSTGGLIPNDPTTDLPDPTKAQWYEWLPWTRRPLPFSALNIG